MKRVVTIALAVLVVGLCCVPGPLSGWATLVCIAACAVQTVLATR